MKAPLFIDCETMPLPEAECAQFMPEFKAPANIKDPAKIAEAIAAKKTAWQEDAALDARRARVLVVGIITPTGFVYSEDWQNEKTVLEWAITAISGTLRIGERVVGHNLLGFDMPMLCRRAWKLGVHVPMDLRQGRYWNELLTDTMDLWRLGVSPDQGRISLDHLAKHLGVGQKNGNGADFALLWSTDRPKALAYLENDLKLTKACYEKMTS